jgi:heme O synthase-like polyprenyltransferase
VTLTGRELLGFAVIAGAFVVLFAALELEPGSWAGFGLFATFIAILVVYRTWLKRRRA